MACDGVVRDLGFAPDLEFGSACRLARLRLQTPLEYPELVQHLLLCLLRQLPTPEHRLALSELTDDLLRAMLNHEGSGALHEWLRGLTFIRMTSRGLAPYDEIRRWLIADLRWPAPTTERILI